MATSNQINLGLSGSSGTGTFVGSTSPTISRPLIDNTISGYTTTATAAGNTTLTVSSTYQQFFTGVTTQTVIMPVTSTLTIGQSWLIVNNSTGIVTVQSSGLNNIIAISGGSNSIVTVIAQAGTTAADWNAEGVSGVAGVDSITGTTNQVIASAATGAVTLSLPQSIATSSAVTFGSVGFSSTSGIIGTTTNDAAAAGSVGELLSSTILSASAVSFTSNVYKDLTSISLTAGDWDIWGNIHYVGTTVTLNISGISTTTATLPDSAYVTYLAVSSATQAGATTPAYRVSISGTTTYYLVGLVIGTGTLTGRGGIYARRMR